MKTLLELRTYLRDLIDEEDEARWTNAELNRYINAKYRLLTNEIRHAGTGYYIKADIITTTPNNKLASLPSDFAGVITALQDEDNIPITYTDVRAFNWTGKLKTGTPKNYSFFGGNQIWLYPTPDAIYTFEIDYEYMPSALMNDTDEIVFPIGYEELIILGAVIDAKLKDHQRLSEVVGIYENLKREMLRNLKPTQTFRGSRQRCLNTERNRL